jgi:hypothetical protein
MTWPFPEMGNLRNAVSVYQMTPRTRPERGPGGSQGDSGKEEMKAHHRARWIKDKERQGRPKAREREKIIRKK